MRQKAQCNAWVVYRMTTIVSRTPTEVNVVCEQEEWEGIQREKPDTHTLVRGGIATEEEAEKLARGTSGNPVPRRGSAGHARKQAEPAITPEVGSEKTNDV